MRNNMTIRLPDYQTIQQALCDNQEIRGVRLPDYPTIQKFLCSNQKIKNTFPSESIETIANIAAEKLANRVCTEVDIVQASVFILDDWNKYKNAPVDAIGLPIADYDYNTGLTYGVAIEQALRECVLVNRFSTMSL